MLLLVSLCQVTPPALPAPCPSPGAGKGQDTVQPGVTHRNVPWYRIQAVRSSWCPCLVPAGSQWGAMPPCDPPPSVSSTHRLAVPSSGDLAVVPRGVSCLQLAVTATP